jgi:hypothetical protein
MSALAKVRHKTEPAPAPMLPEQIRGRIAELKAKAIDLDRAQLDLAELSIKEPEAERLYQDNISEGVRVDGEIKRLELALASFETKAAAAQSAAAAAELSALRQRVCDLLEQRIEAAQAFEAAITAAVEALHDLAELSERALQAWPGPQPDPAVTALGNAAITNLAAAEMYRLGRVAGTTGQGPTGARPVPSLPGIKAPSLNVIDVPQEVTPLVAAIADANTLAREFLEGRR